jgi:hypothetical protein
MSRTQDKKFVDQPTAREPTPVDGAESVRSFSESVQRRISYMENNPSLKSVFAVMDTLTEANHLGFRPACPIEYRTAIETAGRVARSLDASQLRVARYRSAGQHSGSAGQHSGRNHSARLPR